MEVVAINLLIITVVWGVILLLYNQYTQKKKKENLERIDKLYTCRKELRRIDNNIFELEKEVEILKLRFEYVENNKHQLNLDANTNLLLHGFYVTYTKELLEKSTSLTNLKAQKYKLQLEIKELS